MGSVKIDGERYRVRKARVNDQPEQMVYKKGYGKNIEVFVMNEDGTLAPAVQKDVTLYTGYRKPKHEKNNYETEDYTKEKTIRIKKERAEELVARNDNSYYEEGEAELGPRTNGERWTFKMSPLALDKLVGRVGDFATDDGGTRKAQVKYDFETDSHYIEVVSVSSKYPDMRVTQRAETNEKGEIIQGSLGERQYQIKEGNRWVDYDRAIFHSKVRTREANLVIADQSKPEQGI